MNQFVNYLNQVIILSGYNPDINIQVSFCVIAVQVVLITALVISLFLKIDRSK